MDTYPDNCDLIVCRNVLIYFTDDAKNRIYNKFYNALKDKGLLFVGSTEQMLGATQLAFKALVHFYMKYKTQYPNYYYRGYFKTIRSADVFLEVLSTPLRMST